MRSQKSLGNGRMDKAMKGNKCTWAIPVDRLIKSIQNTAILNGTIQDFTDRVFSVGSNLFKLNFFMGGDTLIHFN